MIDTAGAIRPDGAVAHSRLRARQGRFHVLPAPAHLVVMKQDGDHRPCPLSGEIRTSGAVCDVVSLIGHAGWRGEFVLMDENTSRSVYFDQGQVVGAQSTAEKERIGQVLYRYGVLSEDQVTACVDAAAEGDLRFGEIAVKRGFLAREQLFHLMGRQTEEVFYAMLLASRGMFFFLEGFDDAVLAARQSYSVSTLVREGVRRMHETRYFRARMPSDRHVPTRMPGRSEPDADPLGVFAAADGRRSIADLCRVTGHGEFEVSRALFQLIQAGHVLIKPPRLSVDQIVELYNRAVSLILRELDAMDRGDDVRAELLSFAASSPRYRALFDGAEPSEDGAVSAAKIAPNMATLGAGDPEENLGRALFELASYAMFVARPHVGRGENPRNSARLSQRIAALLEPLAPPAAPASTPPPSTRKP